MSSSVESPLGSGSSSGSRTLEDVFKDANLSFAFKGTKDDPRALRDQRVYRNVKLSMERRRKAHFIDRQRAILDAVPTITLLYGPPLDNNETLHIQLAARKLGAELVPWNQWNRSQEEAMGMPFLGSVRFAIAYPCAPRHTYGHLAGGGFDVGESDKAPHVAETEKHENAVTEAAAAAAQVASASKIFNKIFNRNEWPNVPKGMIKLGVFHTREKSWYAPSDLENLEKLGDPAQVYGKLLGAIHAPATQLVSTIDGARGGRLLARLVAPSQVLTAVLANRKSEESEEG